MTGLRSIGTMISGGRRAIAESTVGSVVVVVPPPLFDRDSRLAQAVEDLAVDLLPDIRAIANWDFPPLNG